MKGKIVGSIVGTGRTGVDHVEGIKSLTGGGHHLLSRHSDQNPVQGHPASPSVDMERVRLFPRPMSKDRTFANQAYDALCTEIASLVATGKNVAITAEGDSGFYSSVN